MERNAKPPVSEYQYQSRLDGHSIRLLSIHPRTSNEAPLHCSLETFDLRNKPEFVALSYTWGNAEDVNDVEGATVDSLQEERSLSILLDSQSMTVAPNLLDALLQLQALGIDGPLWVDAMCINQADIVERSVQVSIMGDIYSSAELVIVWLGKDLHNDAVKMGEIVSRLAELWNETQNAISTNHLTGAGTFDFEDPAILESYGLQDMNNDIWASFILFLNRRWFYRTWAVQEVVLSKRVVFLCGAVWLSWAELYQCFLFLSVSNLGRGLEDLQSRLKFAKSGKLEAHRPGRSLGTVASLAMLCEGPTSIPKLPSEFSVLLDRTTGNQEIVRSTATILIVILFFMNSFNVTDARDTIYGVLGLLDRAAKAHGLSTFAIPVDYTQPPEIAFLSATQHIIEETQSLGILSLVPDLSLRTLISLPSWTPLFAVRGPNPLAMLDKFQGVLRFDASKSRSSTSKMLIIEGPVLKVSCFQLSAISECSEPWLDIHAGGHFTALFELILRCDDIYFTGEPRVEAVWRTLIGNVLPSTYPAPATLGASFRSWIELLVMAHVLVESRARGTTCEEYLRTLTNIDILAKSDPQRIIPSIDELLRSYEEMIKDPSAFRKARYAEMPAYASITHLALPYRRLLRTSSGHICLGPQSAAPGDVVFIVSGCQTPLIFRNVQSPSESRNMILLGEAYVHGMMHGEALERNVIWEEVSLV